MHVIGGRERLRLHQWSNDWISADTPYGGGVILRPTQVELDADEAEQIQQHPEHAGVFWQLWELYEHRHGRWRLRQRTTGRLTR